MYHREDGRYEYKRRDNRDEDSKDRGARRNRWDERGGESQTSQSPNRLTSDRSREESRSSNWADQRRDGDRESSSSNVRSRERSRSRSPFRRSFRDCANPFKDEYTYQNDLQQTHSLKQNDNQPGSTSKNTSWSDSSDEDERPEKLNLKPPSLEFKNKSYRDERKHEMPSTATYIKPSTGETDTSSSSTSGISLKLKSVSSSTKPLPLPKVISVSKPVKSTKVAAIFNADDSDSEEEMPPECKMRMKNVGRETKTSEGPNSFGKTKIGFCNMSHLAEKELEGKPALIKKP